MVHQYLIGERKMLNIPAVRSPTKEAKRRRKIALKEEEERRENMPAYAKRAESGLPIFCDEFDDEPLKDAK